MINKILIYVSGSLAVATAFADCELLSVADAELVLGPSVSDLSGEDAASQCMFIGGSPQGAFVIQFGSRDYYNQVTILPPHTPADIGDEGRSNVDNNGVIALQFVQGDRSVTMPVRSVSSLE